MKKTLLYVRTMLRFAKKHKNIEAKCRRDAIFFVNALAGNDEDVEILFHYISEVLYLFDISPLSTSYATVVKLHQHFRNFWPLETDKLFSPNDFDQYEVSQFIVLIAHVVWQAKELQTHILKYDGKTSTRESASRLDAIKQIVANAQEVTKEVFPDMKDKMQFFGDYFTTSYAWLLSKARKNTKQKKYI